MAFRLVPNVVNQGCSLPKRSPKQRAAFKALSEAKTRKALGYAFRLSPHIAAWQADGLSQRQLVDALNAVGAPVPSEYTGEPYAPVPVKQWTLRQVQRLLDQIPVAKRKMAFWAKRQGKSNVFPFGDGAGLFANPEAAPKYAYNKPDSRVLFTPAGWPYRHGSYGHPFTLSYREWTRLPVEQRGPAEQRELWSRDEGYVYYERCVKLPESPQRRAASEKESARREAMTPAERDAEDEAFEAEFSETTLLLHAEDKEFYKQRKRKEPWRK
jgi:hypothetical protein